MSTNTVSIPTKTEKSKSFSRPRTQGSTGSSKKGSNKSKYGKKRNQKKNLKPVVAPRGPVKEYVSACCSALASKPRAGRKETAADPESKKMKEVTKGLGHWRCSTCGKPTKVTPRTPAPKEVVTVVAPPAQMLVEVNGDTPASV